MTTLSPVGAKSQPGSTTKKSFGKTPDGQPVDLYVLTNKSGAEVSITNYGGAVVSLKVPDRNGKLADVVLGYDTVDATVKTACTAASRVLIRLCGAQKHFLKKAVSL